MNKFEGMKAITFGVFDLLHYGHFELFRRIREMVGPSGEVIVMLQNDEWITKFKEVKVVYNYGQRKQMVDSDLLMGGSEHTNERFQRLGKWCAGPGKMIVVLPRIDGISTMKLNEIIGQMAINEVCSGSLKEAA